MSTRKYLKLMYWKRNTTIFQEAYNYDKQLYMSWSKSKSIGKRTLLSSEWRYIRCFRQAIANSNTIWKHYYNSKLSWLTKRTGIWIPPTITCGKGLTIGHWGRIIVNPKTIIGDDFSISSGAVIGRDVRGRRAGVPKIGNRVCLKVNAVVVGKITIGDDVLIAPNAFVNFDVPSHSVVVGNPGIIHSKMNATEGHIGVVN